MTDLSEKLAYNREVSRHLVELGLLVGRSVHSDELLSLEDTKRLRSRANTFAREPTTQFEIPFEEKQSPRFAEFIRRLAEANPSDVYLWTPASNSCGILPPIRMSQIDITFPFNLNSEGIVAILAADFQDQLLLDYSTEDDDEQQLLEVEASGEHWSRVAY